MDHQWLIYFITIENAQDITKIDHPEYDLNLPIHTWDEI